jgi:hypothetical protein
VGVPRVCRRRVTDEVGDVRDPQLVGRPAVRLCCGRHASAPSGRVPTTATAGDSERTPARGLERLLRGRADPSPTGTSSGHARAVSGRRARRRRPPRDRAARYRRRSRHRRHSAASAPSSSARRGHGRGPRRDRPVRTQGQRRFHCPRPRDARAPCTGGGRRRLLTFPVRPRSRPRTDELDSGGRRGVPRLLDCGRLRQRH